MLFGRSELVQKATFDKPERHVKLWATLTTGLLSSYF
jgi:hypothetical protein